MKNPTRNCLKLCRACLLLLTFPVFADYEQEFEASLMVISDDNPYKLPDAGGSSTAQVLELDYDFETALTSQLELHAEAGAEKSFYSSSYSDADEEKFDLEVGLSHMTRFSGPDRLKVEGGLYYQSKDETYVSRSTGEVAVSRGQEIPDRFSHDTRGLSVEMDYYLGRQWRFSLDLDYRERDYIEDYEELGLSKFDYSELSIEPAVRYRPTHAWELSIKLPFSRRDYDDRRGEDLDGDDIPGTDLEYDTDGWEVEVGYTPNDLIELEVGYRELDREDNYFGRRDYEKDTIKAAVEITPTNRDTFELSYRSTDRDSNKTFSSFDEEELRSAGEDKLKLEYEREMRVSWARNLTLLFVFEKVTADHTTPLLEYDRKSYSLGFIVDI